MAPKLPMDLGVPPLERRRLRQSGRCASLSSGGVGPIALNLSARSLVEDTVDDRQAGTGLTAWGGGGAATASDTESTTGRSVGIDSLQSELEAERVERLAERQLDAARIAEAQQALQQSAEAGQLLLSRNNTLLAELQTLQDEQEERAESDEGPPPPAWRTQRPRRQGSGGDAGRRESQEHRLKLECRRLERLTGELREQLLGMAEQGSQRQHKPCESDCESDVAVDRPKSRSSGRSSVSSRTGRARCSVSSRPPLDADRDMMEECHRLYVDNQRLAADRQAEAQRAEELAKELELKAKEAEEAAAETREVKRRSMLAACHHVVQGPDAGLGPPVSRGGSWYRSELAQLEEAQLATEANRQLQLQLEEVQARHEAASRDLESYQGLHAVLEARASVLEEELDVTRGCLEQQLHVSEALREEAEQLRSALQEKALREEAEQLHSALQEKGSRTPCGSRAVSPASSWLLRRSNGASLAISRGGSRSSSVDHWATGTSLAAQLGHALQGYRGFRRGSRHGSLSSEASLAAAGAEVFRIDTDGAEGDGCALGYAAGAALGGHQAAARAPAVTAEAERADAPPPAAATLVAPAASPAAPSGGEDMARRSSRSALAQLEDPSCVCMNIQCFQILYSEKEEVPQDSSSACTPQQEVPKEVETVDRHTAWDAEGSPEPEPLLPAPAPAPREPKGLKTVTGYSSGHRSSETSSTRTSVSSLQLWRLDRRESAPRPGVVKKLTQFFGGRRPQEQPEEQQRTWAVAHLASPDASEGWE